MDTPKTLAARPGELASFLRTLARHYEGPASEKIGAAADYLDRLSAPDVGVGLTDDDPFVLSIAKAIASQGVGRPWDDFDEVNASELDQSDLICYAKAAASILALATPDVGVMLTRYGHHGAFMLLQEDGEYVRYEDVAPLLAAARAVPADVVLETTAKWRQLRLDIHVPELHVEDDSDTMTVKLIRDVNTLTAALAASTAREKAKDAVWNERCADVRMLAHNWMVAHDNLKAGLPYDYPSPADLPEALKAKDEEIAELRALLTDLRALVRGEAPSLLNEDSGGDAELSLQIDAALSGRKPDKEGT